MADDSIVNILIAVDRKLSDRSKWTTDAYAISNTGRPILPTSRWATSWCLAGAILAVTNMNKLKTFQALSLLEKHSGIVSSSASLTFDLAKQSLNITINKTKKDEIRPSS